MVESEKAARQRKEDSEVKSRARSRSGPGSSSGGSRGNRERSRRHHDRDRDDREAKRRAKQRSGGGEEMKPGVTNERSTRDTKPKSLGSRSSSQRSNRDDKDRAAKQRARSGGSRSRRPGIESVSTGDSTEARIRGKQSRDESRRRSSRSNDGRRSSSSRSVQGQRPGVSLSRRSDHKKNLDHGKTSSGKSTEPVAPAAGAEGVAVEATAIDEEAQENERMRALEEQNRALADRMEELNNDRDKEAEGERAAVEEERKEKQKKKKRNICILVCFLLAAGGGAAAYFLAQKTGAPAATPPASPPDDGKDIVAPIVPSVNETQPPLAPDSSEGPSSSPAVDTYDPPSNGDCDRIRSRLAIEGQEDLDTSPFRMAFDVAINNDSNLSTDAWLSAFQDGIDQVLIPSLAGCSINRRLQSIDQEPQNVTSTATVERTFPRGLLEVESEIRYVIANAEANIDPSRDVTDDCETKREGCNNVKVSMELFLKGEVKGFALETLIAQILGALLDLESNGNRKLENNNRDQPHHRKLLAKILGLDQDIFESVRYRGKENADPPPFEQPTLGPTEPPTTPMNEPTGEAPTPIPSDTPSWVPSNMPSSKPTMAPVVGPTPPPTKAPTKAPTAPPTKAPTLPPTPGPTPAPAAGPTVSPSSSPSVLPSATPSFFPTSTPTSGPTSFPTSGPTSFPTSGPTSSPTSPPTSGPTASPTSRPTTCDPSCSVGEMVCDSTSASVTDGLCGSCNGSWACRGYTGSIGDNSCNGDDSCRHTYNTDVNIGDNSCTQGANSCRNLRSVTIGDNSCNCEGCCACLADGSTIGDGQCNNPGDCCNSVGGPLNVGTGSCTNGELDSCVGAKGPIGAGSCLTSRSCQSSRAQIGDNSCKGVDSCLEFNTIDLWFAELQLGSIGVNSCQGEYACSKMTGSIGNNSCQGSFACRDRKTLTVGIGSCQCDHCCQCLEAGTVVGDGLCNTPGECCSSDGSPLAESGEACTSDSDCISGTCPNSYCAIAVAPGAVWSNNSRLTTQSEFTEIALEPVADFDPVQNAVFLMITEDGYWEATWSPGVGAGGACSSNNDFDHILMGGFQLDLTGTGYSFASGSYVYSRGWLPRTRLVTDGTIIASTYSSVDFDVTIPAGTQKLEARCGGQCGTCNAVVYVTKD